MIRNTFVRTDTTRTVFTTLAEAFKAAQRSHQLFERLEYSQGWEGLLGKERKYISVEGNSGAMVNLILVVVKEATHQREINRNQVPGE